MRHLRFETLRTWYFQYERLLLPASLLAGLISDFLLFQYIDVSLAFSLLAGHLTIAALVIAFIHAKRDDQLSSAGKVTKFARLFAPLLLQYSFGALLSAFFIFYWFSGSFFASWPFIALVAFLMVSNDLLRKYYLRLPIALGVYYFILFSYAALVLPYVIATIEPWVFIAAGVASLGVMLVYLSALTVVIPRVLHARFLIGNIIMTVFLGLHALYFANLIPPVPLSIRDAGVFHGIERTEMGDYLVLAEGRSPIHDLLFGTVIHREQHAPVYVYSAIFAPTQLETRISHHWKYYDESKAAWVSMGLIEFPIAGGRDQGYRGYTRRVNVFPGKWRVEVVTARGQVIGRVPFTIVNVTEPVPMLIEYR